MEPTPAPALRIPFRRLLPLFAALHLGLALSTVSVHRAAAQVNSSPTGPASSAATSSVPLNLPETAPLDWTDDIASRLVDGVDRFLLGQIADSMPSRARHWQRDLSSSENYVASVQPNRQRLARVIGVVDQRPPHVAFELVTTLEQPSLIAKTAEFEVHQIRWLAFGDVHAEGLLLRPVKGAPRASVIAIPHADVTPEQICGLVAGVEPPRQYARRLAEQGFQVVVPMIVSRAQSDFAWGGGRRHRLTNREFLYRPAFELGRHLIGYEVQKILAAVDALAIDHGAESAAVGVVGWGEGGLLALYAAALDPRIDATMVSGYFASRQNVWQEPIDRNVFGLLDQFGDAEIASLIAPRPLVVEACRGPEYQLPPNNGGGAPARLVSPAVTEVRAEFDRALQLIHGLQPTPAWKFVPSLDADQATADGLPDFARALAGADVGLPAAGQQDLIASTYLPEADRRLYRQMQELDRHSQEVLRESPFVRQEFMKRLDTSSLTAYQESVERYRELFRREVVGHFDLERLPPRPRTRLAYHGSNWDGWEVVLDVFPDVIAYGVLLVPRDLAPGEQRPVVVCQHGLEGRPVNIIEGNQGAYHDFAARLAERGFITFAPQNLYIFQDRFRTLQRKANAIQKTLFSVIVPQHQQIVDWLKTLPYVDRERIAFYGLSYGGKSAMRIPPLVTDYCLSICSADFNEWVDKNASTRNPHSYVWGGEYEIFEFDLGSTFNYAEMAALIAPRPFMVERGHFDGVASDETVAAEFAKVRNLYAARLKIPARCEIEWFDGPHTINGQGTYEFLHRHLFWPKPTP